MSVLPPHEVALQIGGSAYLGWTTLTVDSGIDAMTGSFDLEFASSERTGAQDWPIEEGATCQVTLGEFVLVTGHIDVVARFISAEQRGIRVQGRDRAADLVDCSAIHPTGSWQNRSLPAIAALHTLSLIHI